MHPTDPLQFYSTQSPITDPRNHTNFLSKLPNNIPDLCEIISGIFLHIDQAIQKEIKITPKNSGTYTRYVDLMLAQILQMNDQSIHQPRPDDQKLVSNCRDDSVLLCSFLRHLNIPSRIRYGFSTYFAGINDNFGANHVICEYWNKDEKRWILVDPGQDETLTRKNQLTFDPHDVPRDQFITAANAWTLCRQNLANPNDFGFGPFEPTLKGQWYIQTELMHEFGSFNKMELLLRDRWGLGDCWHIDTISEPDLNILDRIASLITNNQHTPTATQTLSQLQKLYQIDNLKIPNIITCYKYDGTTQKFNLKTRKPISTKPNTPT